jgi:sialate O-acetylesterase
MIEAWMSNDALAADPVLKEGAEKAQNDRRAFDQYSERYKEWQKKYGREDRKQGDPATFAGPDVDTSDWRPVTLPGFFAEAGLPEAGAIWVRRKVPAPSAPDITPRKGIDMFLDNIRDSNEVYWNGRRVGSSPIDSVVHRYGVKGEYVNEGENVLALRVFSAGESGGIAPGGSRFQGNHVPFKGEWLAKVEYAFPPLDKAAMDEFPKRPATPIDSQNVAGYLYNGMIHPLIPYAIRGVIWYQGEGNWNRGYQYRAAFPAMIADWRAKWGRGDLPFYYCQIANLGAHSKQPERTSAFAEVREAQSMALSLPNTGQAVLIDVGEEEDIHPADKMSVGDRLARIALAQTYGKAVVFSGPVFDSMTLEGDKARIRFKHAAPGLLARPMPETYAPNSKSGRMVPLVRNSPRSEIEGFAICGEDKKWEWANARIEGETVVVWADAVPKPVAVRYAWAQNPFCNLYNAAGLPANPFRTDDFPLASRNAKY